jgi:hypothetical protein
MLIDNCVTCHRQGGIGPWQMTSYEMIKGFAPMIREVVRTERMPPWHADPHYQAFSNDRSLSKDEVKTLVHWIEAGSPRGNGGDPLAELKSSWPEWSLGEPDLIVEIPAFDVPATGTIPYQMPSATNPLDHDVWVRAVDFQPGDRTVLHHIIATMGADGSGIREGGSLGGYVPGAGPMVLPTETGILMKKDAKFFFQMHYTATGKPARDVSRMGLYFRKDAPEYQFRSAVMAKPSLKIPPNTKAHTESASRTFDQRHHRVQSAAALAFPRHGVELRRDVPGRHDRDAAVGAALRLQLADDVRADDAEAPAGRHEDHAQHDRGTTRARTRRTPTRTAKCRGASRPGTRCCTAWCASVTLTRRRRRRRPCRALANRRQRQILERPAPE